MWRLKIFCSALYIVLLFPAVNAVEYEVVLEKEFDREIKNVIFASEDGKMYPKVIVFKDEVCFLTLSSEVKTTIPREYECKGTKLTAGVYLSNNGEYVLLTRFFYGDEELEVIKGGDFKLYDSNGRLLWIKNEPIKKGEESYYIRISNRGVTAIVRSNYVKIDLYDLNGNCETIAPFGPDLDWSHRKVETMWSEDGSKFAVLADKYPLRRYKELPRYSNEFWLILYAENGKEIWRNPIEEYIGDFIHISPSGSYLLVLGHTMAGIGKGLKSKKIYLFIEEGRCIAEFPNIGQYHMKVAFNQNEKVFALYDRERLYLIESKTGEIVWEKDNLSGTPFFTPENNLVIVSFKSYYKKKKISEGLSVAERRKAKEGERQEFSQTGGDVEIYTVDLDGKIIKHIKIPVKKPPKDFTFSDSEIGIRLGKKLLLYQLKEGGKHE